MIPISIARNLCALTLLFPLAALPVQARLGSDKLEETRPDTLTRIMGALKSLVLPQDSSRPDPESELMATPENWPVDKRALHEQILTMIRNSLTRDIVIGNGEGRRDSEQVFMIYVPDHAAKLELTTRGGSGDIDLYVMRGNIPTTARYDCRSAARGTRQNCAITSPEKGIYYVMLLGNARYSGVSVTGTYGLDMPRTALPPAASSPAISAADSGPESPSI